MQAEEVPLVFDCRGEPLVGILHQSASSARVGVVVVVGGPQYRVGSHRQFLLLARYLADKGIPVLRFDYRGMGDSGGEFSGFEDIHDDIHAAIDCLFEHEPQLEKVVLWGLCDAASAAMMHAALDDRLGGLLLLNPWVRSEEGRSRTLVRSYYSRQLRSGDFWRRLIRGDVHFARAGRSLLRTVATAIGLRGTTRQAGTSKPFAERMLEGLSGFSGPVRFVLSGEDLTAAEFSQHVRLSQGWQRLLERPSFQQVTIPDANHTFSSAKWREVVELSTLELVHEVQQQIL